MAVTSSTYSGNGVTRDFAIGFSYTSRSFVSCYVGGVITGAWSFLNATTVRFTVAPPAGTNNIEIRRVTSTTPLADFVGAATITDTDLDLNFLQLNHVLEENQNNSLVGMQQSGGNWDATSDRLVNLATPLAATDAANKDYVDDVIGSVADAEAAQAAAEAAEAGATAQAAAAANSAALADASADLAAGSAAAADASYVSISAVLPVSGLNVDEVPVATSGTSYDAIPIRLHKRLSSGTPSAVGSFDVALPGTHDEYLLDLYNFVMSNAGADVELRFSNDGGASYLSGATDYDYAGRGFNNGATINNQSNADTKIILAGPLNNTFNQPNLKVEVFPGAGGIIYNTLRATGTLYHNGQESYHHILSGRMSVSATRATHLRILASAGTITGSYVLYGVKR